MEIDHAFICTITSAPAGDLLVRHGLLEGSRNRHQGQGTANRRFFFKNFMLELLWVEDEEEATSELTRPMTLYERCKDSDSMALSPFGLAFRPSRNGGIAPNFDWWEYRPKYLPAELSIQVAKNTPLQEPLLFFIPFAKRQGETTTIVAQEPIAHPIGWRELTNLTVSLSTPQSLSAAGQGINAIPGCAIKPGAAPLMELEFDHGGNNKTVDFRPALPLLCRW